MLKGINRRIIEINKTNNEFFEKAILFVRSEKVEFEQNFLSKEADNYLKNLYIQKKPKRLFSLKMLVIALTGILFCLCTVSILLSIL